MTDVARPIPNEPDLEQPPPLEVAPRTNGTSNGHRPKAGPIAPHDLEAERHLLGAALLGAPDALVDVPDGAFYAPAHGHIAHAIRTLTTNARHVDSVTISDHLRATGLLETVGGPAAVAEIMATCPSRTGAPAYARIVLHHARTRALITAGDQLAHVARTQGPDAAYELLRPLIDQNEPHQPGKRRLHTGGWILDASPTPEAIWGRDTEVLWAQGEPCLLTGPPGVGKTTLTAQLVRARIGLDDQVLGWPVAPDLGRVLYLASDRPQQIRRALARCFTPTDRDHLDQHLTIWPGPPPTDLARDTSTLIRLAHEAGATTVILDSLKDMAIGLADDEVGAGLNHAMQLALAEGIDVLALHHQRKGTDGKRPKTLEDLYGSTWIGAGAGSVLLLWGAAGDLVVELHHLKQPATDIGPIKIEHDHHAGTSTIHRGFDLHAALRHAPRGLTCPDVARMWLEKDKPTDNERKKAQRRLDNLVRIGAAKRVEGEGRATDGTPNPARYYALDTTHEELF